MFLDAWLLCFGHKNYTQDEGVHFAFTPLQTGRDRGSRMGQIFPLTCRSSAVALTTVQSSVLSLQHPTD